MGQQYKKKFLGELSQNKKEIPAIIFGRICLQTKPKILWRKTL
jgi:hypothetical protein